MRIEYANLSLIGDREDNQDRVTVAATDKAALLIVIDGMGGHSDGSRAADTALKSLLDSFHQVIEGRTALVIAHRLNTIRDCDVLLILEKGKLKKMRRRRQEPVLVELEVLAR